MAEVEGNSMVETGGADIPNLGANPIFKQLAAMIGIAISVALGVSVVMWTQTPSYSLLQADLAEKDAMEVMDVLQQQGVQYRVDEKTGGILVESGKLQTVRLKLAALGLPRSSDMGFELLQQDTGFGTSRLVEKARHQRAIEGELARTISTISAVQSARVHLALPKQSVFIRKRKKPGASVALKLFSGRKLGEEQIAAITHIVASSVPELEASEVTIIDQKGRLLSGNQRSDALQLSTSQFEYTNKLEEHLRERIYDILVPILGENRVRAQVSADIDFTVVERTRESYDPEMTALRSEQLDEEQSRLSAVQGVPGALSNQPPAAGNAPEVAGGGANNDAGSPLNTTRRSTRNYEIEKTISHTRLSPTNIKRLSVAIVVDDRVSMDETGKMTRLERSPEELDRIAQLVRETIGFNGVRGDTVKVINSSFMEPEPIEDLPPPAIWEEPWFWDVVKQSSGILVVLLLIFVVLKPAMKRLTSNEVATLEGGMAATDGAGGNVVMGPDGKPVLGPDGEPVMDSEGFSLGVGADGEPIRLPGPGNYESVLEAARRLVDEDPKRVAQLVKTWTGN